MKTPLTTGNPIPERCGCWMVRGDDFAYRERCDQFSPNPFATITPPARFNDPRVHEMCYDCDHLEACHLDPEARRILVEKQ